MKKIFTTIIFLLALWPHFVEGQILNIEDKRFKLTDSISFEGKVSLSWNVNKNTNTIWSGNGDVLLAKNHLRSYFLGYGFVNLLRNGEKNLLNDRTGHLRYNYDLNKYVVFEALAQGQYSQQLRIRYRYLFGSGLRFKLHDLIGKRIYLGTGLMQEEMGFQQNEVQAHRLRLGSYVSFTLPVGAAKIISTSYYQPVLKDWATRRISSQTTLQIPLGKGFSFKTAFTLLSDNDPLIAFEVPNFTYQWVNGLIWKIE